jgi:D-3-phosphoglycerate dehydrogenase
MGDGVPGDIRVEFKGRLAERDTRILALSVLAGALRGHTEEDVNLVNAAQLGEARGIEVIETSDPVSEDFTELVTVSVGEGEDRVEVAGTGVGPRNVPYLVRVWGEDFYLPFADNLAIFRYTDQPGMIGLVGSEFGKRGVNIVSAAVGAEAEQAVMALTTDAPVSDDVIDEILKLEGFFAGHAVATA